MSPNLHHHYPSSQPSQAHYPPIPIDTLIDTTAHRSRAPRRIPESFRFRPHAAPPIDDAEEEHEFGDLDDAVYPYSFGREGFPHDMAYASEEHEANGAAAWEEVMEDSPTREEGEDEDEEAETELAEEEERPENRAPEEALVRQLRFLAGEEPAGLAAGETIATLWARAVARQEERLRRLRLSDDADVLPDAPPAPPAHPARHTAFSSPHAAPLTRATIRDFIARNVVGDMDIGAATPSAWAGVPIFPPPELAWRFQCSAPAAGGGCVLDTGFARCALCAWRREAERGEEVLVAAVYVREGGEDFIPLEGGDEIMAEGMAEGEGED